MREVNRMKIHSINRMYFSGVILSFSCISDRFKRR